MCEPTTVDTVVTAPVFDSPESFYPTLPPDDAPPVGFGSQATPEAWEDWQADVARAEEARADARTLEHAARHALIFQGWESI